MKNIALIYMGGTFGCIGEPLSPMPELDFTPQLKRVLPKHISIDFFKTPTVKDSSACTASDWLQLILQIQQLKQQNYQHFIVIHGTDTLSYAAATVAQFLQSSCTVMLTGSQYPLLNIEGNDLRTFTDALNNLNTAIDAISKVSNGVYVAFHHRIMHASTVHKMHSTALDAFHGMGYQTAIENSGNISPFIIQDSHLDQIQQLNILNLMLQPIEIISFANNLKNLLNAPPDVLILQGYGTGNIAVNNEVIDILIALQDKNCRIILDTQVPFGGLDQRYAVSQWAKQSKILINNTQSHADLYAKILKMYLQYPSADQWQDHWYVSSE